MRDGVELRTRARPCRAGRGTSASGGRIERRADAKTCDGLDAGPVADASTKCVLAPRDALCEADDVCKGFFKRLAGDHGELYWFGFNPVCSCAKIPETTVTREIVAREFEADWNIITTDECGDYWALYRDTTSFAMPHLAERPAVVKPTVEFFRPFLAASSPPGSANDKLATMIRDRIGGLKNAVVVRFADAQDKYVTNFLVGFLSSGHLAGVYTDGDRW